MTGGDTAPMATVFAVFASTITTMHEPSFVPVDFEVDVEGRKGRLRIAGHLEMDGEPIRSPVDGSEIRARIDLPDGFVENTSSPIADSPKFTSPQAAPRTTQSDHALT